MSFVPLRTTSLHSLGLEDPSPQEFIDHPDRRTIAAFFLGWTFIACLRYLTLAVLRHPYTARLLKSILRRPSGAIAEPRGKDGDTEANHVQSWLRNTFQGTTKSQSDRPKGTRRLSVALTAAFTIAVFTSFLSLLDFRSSDQDVLCIVAVAWAGISVSCAKLAGLLRITFDHQRLGTGIVERVATRVVLVLSFGATLAHVIISIGATTDVPQIPNLSLCYRKHFLVTSLIVSLLNIAMELYLMGRTYCLLVPQFLQLHHQVEVMMDVRVARVASILVLDLLTLLPSALSINVAAEFVPFSLGTLLVLAAFNHHSKPADPDSPELSAPHRVSTITFPRNKEPEEHSVVSDHEAQAGPAKPETAELAPSRRISLASEPTHKRHTRNKSRALSRISHISYDSEAEARSVNGAIVSFAFKSHEIEPMPAIPYGVYQPKLVGSARMFSRAPQHQLSDAESHDHPGFVASPSPLSRQFNVSAPEQKSLPLPKPSVGVSQLSVTRDRSLPPGPPSGNSIVYGSDVIRPAGPKQPELARHGSSTSTTKSVSPVTSSHASHGYTGPDLHHYSMSSQSTTTYETRDYLGLPPRPTGRFRTSAFGATPKSGVSRSDSGSATASPPSSEGGASRHG